MHLVLPWNSPTVFNSPSSVKQSKVLSETQGNLFLVNFYKIQRNLTKFQYTMAKNKHSHSQREEWGVQQGKMRAKKDQHPAGQTPNPAALCPASGAHGGLPRTWVVTPLQFCHLQQTLLLYWVGSTPCLQLSSGYIEPTILAPPTSWGPCAT